jgi:hypothetical protein
LPIISSSPANGVHILSANDVAPAQLTVGAVIETGALSYPAL